MSAAQAMASQQFLKAMGPMIYESQKVEKVLLYIRSMQQETTISEEKWNSLRTIDELDAHLENRIREHYHRVEA